MILDSRGVVHKKNNKPGSTFFSAGCIDMIYSITEMWYLNFCFARFRWNISNMVYGVSLNLLIMLLVHL